MGKWTAKRIDELCEVTSSKRIFAADYVSEGVPFYRGKEIGEKHHGNLEVTTELFITRSKFESIREKHGAPQAGDLLLTSIGALLGLPYVVREGEEFYFKDGIVDGNVVAEQVPGLWFPGNQRRAGEGYEGCPRQCCAHVDGKRVVLAAMGLIGHHNHVGAVAQHLRHLKLVNPCRTNAAHTPFASMGRPCPAWPTPQQSP
jgi:hypothetical protein